MDVFKILIFLKQNDATRPILGRMGLKNLGSRMGHIEKGWGLPVKGRASEKEAGLSSKWAKPSSAPKMA